MAKKKTALKTQIHRDIERTINDRFRIWLDDSMKLYAMAEIPYQCAIVDIAGMLLSAGSSALITNRVNRSDAMEIMGVCYDNVFYAYTKEKLL